MLDSGAMPQNEFTARRATFRALHEEGCFVMPNPWDAGTARYLRHLGFPALATTSAGAAFSRGLPDAAWAVDRDAMLAHIAEIVRAVDLPVNADFESGYAHAPEEVAVNVALCVETGVAGLSIEDATGDPERPLYELPLAVERIRAAREAIDRSGADVLLTARAECHLVGMANAHEEAIRRLCAYADAGADVLYAPGPRALEMVRAMVEAVRPKPVNILAAGVVDFTVDDLAALGVRRISTGSALARAAWGGFIRAATQLRAEGRFDGFDGAAPFAELNRFFEGDRAGKKAESEGESG
jgi:2-methylisocitrate lyase-like PEP mutase family enzyme